MDPRFRHEKKIPGPNLSKRNLQHRIYPYLLEGVKITRPNQVWSIDITYNSITT